MVKAGELSSVASPASSSIPVAALVREFEQDWLPVCDSLFSLPRVRQRPPAGRFLSLKVDPGWRERDTKTINTF